MRKIELPCHGIKVKLSQGELRRNGTITSDLREELPSWHDPRSDDEEVKRFNAAIDGIESLILAHAIAGVNIQTAAYLEGIETAVESCANNF